MTYLEKAHSKKPDRKGTYVLHEIVEWRKTRQRSYAMVYARDGTICHVLNYN